ncbi:MAG: hypothetical protein A3E21_03940 [Sulfurimonas sp. RIFCSPHIGHO2_12_FULL_36_9]|uniref:hypothetical protein n=1 Tax=Sulfurimonas sp. RIFCSPLOWO2_12_36_12 TaxID=1802253 RepID=UPI0008B03C0D|nr:hypothetical protein [Sulfurimonas sp. RIFCSPLOWO2_12_36_12]OHD97229.1 MAG: hypothetical protein A3J26_01035 [Sulfurimonas sp. RIFCSPLOWO2_02_FULL_36_28]OHD97618.1 MAG: hypothetical protein A3E21_03940 [Sulfurimonas sp. RIFCSPHIGHO2_12_FULL_36_9]OHE00876.1 MAG: hypothetical protein A2W82_00280 [Sulfurimonas sp. RIFCSPLOWO2_12_36_12]OHE08385.1 MAG: hypothetical protein A3K14_03635 [Sulfurimonas sp. RIFCSPLOWO2_12_FULL_36_74]
MKKSEIRKKIEVLEHNISVAKTLPTSDNTQALLETLKTMVISAVKSEIQLSYLSSFFISKYGS